MESIEEAIDAADWALNLANKFWKPTRVMILQNRGLPSLDNYQKIWNVIRHTLECEDAGMGEGPLLVHRQRGAYCLSLPLMR